MSDVLILAQYSITITDILIHMVDLLAGLGLMGGVGLDDAELQRLNSCDIHYVLASSQSEFKLSFLL